jgi:hypothetical protein
MYRSLQIAALTACSIVGMNAANIVVNGGFESPDIPSGSFSLLPSIPGWTLASGPSIEIQDHTAGSPFEGQQFLELDGSGNSSIFQDLVTVPGAYVLSFAFSPRPGVAVNSMDVRWNGSLLATVSASGTGLADTQWITHTYNVTATGALTRLQFTGTGPSDSLGEYLDAVGVDNVPEPASLLSVMSGVAFLISYRMVRRSR